MVENLFITHVNPADLAGPEPAIHDQLSEKARSSNGGEEEPFEPSSGLQQDQHLSETTTPSTAVKIMGPAVTVEGTEAVDEVIADQAPMSFDLETQPDLYQVDSSFTPAAPIQPLPLPSYLPDPNHRTILSAVADSPKQLAESVRIASSAPPVMEGAGAEASREEELAAIEAEGGCSCCSGSG